MKLEKRLWMYWRQGEANTPRVVKACLASWRLFNPTWDVRLLDGGSPEVAAASHLWKGRRMGIAAQSDLLRLWLLSSRGGVWADATTLCLRPLDEWLLKVFDGSFGFYAFANAPIATWFLASARRGPVIVEWMERSKNYWKRMKPNRYHYFWARRIFKQMLEDMPALNNIKLGDARIGHGAPRGPHAFADWSRVNALPIAPSLLRRLVTEAPPLLKLQHHQAIKPGTQVDLLVSCFEGQERDDHIALESPATASRPLGCVDSCEYVFQ